MTEPNIYIISPIIISALALIVSILSFMNSRESLKVNEKEHKISQEEHDLNKEKENKKENLNNFLELLTATSKTFKELMGISVFTSMDYLMSDIMQEVYENKKLNLVIKFKYLDVNEEKVSIESVHSVKFLKDELNAYIKNKEKTGITVCPCLYYETLPNLPYSERFELMDIFEVLEDLKLNLDDLKEFELFIDSFDSGLLDTMNNEYDELLELIYKTLNKGTFLFEFNSDMKPSDIEKTLYNNFNLTEIKNKSEFIATVLKGRVDEISKELTMRVLT